MARRYMVTTLQAICEAGGSFAPGRFMGFTERTRRGTISKSGGGEAHAELLRLNGESHVLEERIAEDIARLLGHWGE